MSVDKVGGTITLATGAQYTAAYRSAHPTWTKGHLFGKDILNDILGQSGCMGIRMYYGIDANGAKQLVLVGVNASGNDMTTGIIGDRSDFCPSTCGTSNSLNG
jgi:hypothetical protein